MVRHFSCQGEYLGTAVIWMKPLRLPSASYSLKSNVGTSIFLSVLLCCNFLFRHQQYAELVYKVISGSRNGGIMLITSKQNSSRLFYWSFLCWISEPKVHLVLLQKAACLEIIFQRITACFPQKKNNILFKNKWIKIMPENYIAESSW